MTSLILKFLVLMVLVMVRTTAAMGGTFDLLGLVLGEKSDFAISNAANPTTEPSAEPTQEPTAAPTSPSNIPTIAPTRPTASPVADPQYMSYDVDLKLTNATSNILDSTAINILQSSVANASQVQPSDVTLVSYTATAARVISERSGHATQLKTTNLFMSMLNVFSPVNTQSEEVHRSMRMSTLAANTFTIRAVCAIRVALADYPQYNGNITALYTSLTNNLLRAVSDNSLTTTIRLLSVQANSVTFQYINGVEVLEITLPLLEGFPTAMPTAAPNNSGPKYTPGEIAGMIIALMVGLAVFVIALYYCVTYRKPERSEVYLYVEPASPMNTLMNSPGKSDNVTVRNQQRSVPFDHEVVDL